MAEEKQHQAHTRRRSSSSSNLDHRLSVPAVLSRLSGRYTSQNLELPPPSCSGSLDGSSSSSRLPPTRASSSLCGNVWGPPVSLPTAGELPSAFREKGNAPGDPSLPMWSGNNMSLGGAAVSAHGGEQGKSRRSSVRFSLLHADTEPLPQPACWSAAQAQGGGSSDRATSCPDPAQSPRALQPTMRRSSGPHAAVGVPKAAVTTAPTANPQQKPPPKKSWSSSKLSSMKGSVEAMRDLLAP